MNFWIKKYNLQLEQLPLGLVLSSAVVVVICTCILSTILLFLPIQDKIRGDVNIYTSGQPLSLHAPSDGFFYMYKDENEEVERGELIASIDVRVTEAQLSRLEDLIFGEFGKGNFEYEELLGGILEELPIRDYRQIINELYKLQDFLVQLRLHKSAADPEELIKAIDQAIAINSSQTSTYATIDNSIRELIILTEGQLYNDSLLLGIGGLSERDLQETYKTLIQAKKDLIENNLRKQEIERLTTEDERNKIDLRSSYNTKLVDLRTDILTQEGIIRSQFQAYKEEYLILAPVEGILTLPYGTVENETVQSGDQIFLLTRKESEEQVESLMFVNENNIGKVKPGMMVRIGLSQYDQKEFGIYYTEVLDVSEVPQNGMYKIKLHCELPIKTSYEKELRPIQKTYSGSGEILLGKINLLTKISREINFNRSKYAFAGSN